MASANDCKFEVARKGERLILEGTDCQSLKREVIALRGWAEASGETLSKFPNLEKVRAGCQVDVTGSVPREVSKLHGRYSASAGPNCWNSALVSTGLLKDLRVVKGDEFTSFMSSPLCKKISSSESKRPGDVGAIREFYMKDDSDIGRSGAMEVHGFVYISENLVYQKSSSSEKAKWELTCPQKQFKENMMMSEADVCRANAESNREQCHRGVEYYHCMSMSEFLDLRKDSFDTNQLSVLEEVQKIDCAIGRLTQRASSGSVLNLAKTTVAALAIVLNDQIKKLPAVPPLSDQQKDQAFLLENLKLRLESLNRQIQILEDRK